MKYSRPEYSPSNNPYSKSGIPNYTTGPADSSSESKPAFVDSIYADLLGTKSSMNLSFTGSSPSDFDRKVSSFQDTFTTPTVPGAVSPIPGTPNQMPPVAPVTFPAGTNPVMPQRPSSPRPTSPGTPPIQSTIPGFTTPGAIPGLLTQPTMPISPTRPTQPATPGPNTVLPRATMPTIPMAPVRPATPTNPMTPGMPATPTNPMMPGMPAAPANPMMPGMPATPTNPMMPGMPTAPTVPTIPGLTTPTMPTMPFDHLNSTLPTAPVATPTGPVFTLPVLPTIPAIPNIPSVPGDNTVPNTPGNPIATLPNPSSSFPGTILPTVPQTPGFMPRVQNYSDSEANHRAEYDYGYPGGYMANNVYMTDTSPYHVPLAVPMMPLYGYDNCEDAAKDFDYMKQLYPKKAKLMLSLIEEECDKLEYDGSFMFDEYPDRVYLGRLADKIYHNLGVVRESSISDSAASDSSDWLKDMTEVLLYNEMLERRKRYRGRKRWF